MTAEDPPRAAARASRRPSRVATLTALAAALAAFVFAAWSLPIDDFWLSIVSGQAILHGADLSRAIPLTWLPTLPDALNPQWGAQLILGAFDVLAWSLAVNALLLVVGMGLTFERMRRRAAGPAVAVAALLGLAVIGPHLLARAQSFSIALFPLGLLLVERLRGRWWLVPVFGLLVAAWANLHGAFIVGQLAAGCFLLGAGWEWWRAAHAPDALEARRATFVYAATAALSLAAPLVNPVGVRLLTYAYAQGTSDLIRQISVEWQPSWPTEPIALLFWALVVLLIAGRLARRGGARPGELLLVAATALLAASSIRHIPWFVLAATPLLAEDVDRLLATHPRLSRALGRLPAWTGGRTGALLIGLALVAVAAQPLRTVLPAGIARLTPDEPVVLADAIRSRSTGPLAARVLNEQVWGGYLDWTLRGRLETAMDGRIEIRSVESWRSYFDDLDGKGDAARRLEQENVAYVLVFTSRTELLRDLANRGWREVLRSGDAVLLAQHP